MADLRKGDAQGSDPSGDAPPAYPSPGYGPPGYAPPGYAGYGPPPGYPSGYGGQTGPPPQPPSSNIGWAIAALFTFWPLAIPSFIFSSRVESYWFQGNWWGAQKASHDARLYGIIAVVVGGVMLVLAVLIFVFVFVVFAHTVDEINRHVPTFSPQPLPS